MQKIYGKQTLVTVSPAVALGGEDRLGPLLAQLEPVALTVALFSLSATPETENHAAFVAALGAALSADAAVVALVDESAFLRRFGADSSRLADRRATWRRILASRADIEPVFVSLEADDLSERAAQAIGSYSMRFRAAWCKMPGSGRAPKHLHERQQQDHIAEPRVAHQRRQDDLGAHAAQPQCRCRQGRAPRHRQRRSLRAAGDARGRRPDAVGHAGIRRQRPARRPPAEIRSPDRLVRQPGLGPPHRPRAVVEPAGSAQRARRSRRGPLPRQRGRESRRRRLRRARDADPAVDRQADHRAGQPDGAAQRAGGRGGGDRALARASLLRSGGAQGPRAGRLRALLGAGGRAAQGSGKTGAGRQAACRSAGCAAPGRHSAGKPSTPR